MEIDISKQNLTGHFNAKEYCKENNINITEVTYLYCNRNELKSLDLTGLKNLKELDCYNNELERLDLTDLENLEYLDCRDNELKSLDVTGLKNLKEIYFN